MMVIFDNLESDIIIKTSIEIQKFMKKMQISELWKNIRVWIWINSWNVILWTIWSNNRMEITIIWDVVNTASRIEWLTRNNWYNIIISESTYKNLKIPNNYKIIDLWLTSLKWKKSKIKIYGVWL
jgi:class 3 adenylate cyclase